MTKERIKEIKKLKEDLEKMTADRDSSIVMYRTFLEQSQMRGKALELLVPLLDVDEITKLLAKSYDMNRDIERLKAQKKYLSWQKDNPGKRFSEYLQSMGAFKEE